MQHQTYLPFVHAARLEQRSQCRVETCASAQACLGNPRAVENCRKSPRPCFVQFCHRHLVTLMLAEVYAAGQVNERASIIQSRTRQPVRFEITEGTRKSLFRRMEEPQMFGSEFLWPGRFQERLHISTRQYASGARLGAINRAGSERVRTPFDAADESCADLREDRKPTRCSVPAWTHKDGQHRQIPRF